MTLQEMNLVWALKNGLITWLEYLDLIKNAGGQNEE